jgi:hypothetical protein
MPDVGVLTGQRVTLRAPRLDDADELFAAVASDPAVTRYMSWTPHPDVGETRRVITELFNVGSEVTWLIQLRETGQIIGTCGFRKVQPHSRDFGYCLGQRWWGRGIMPEVAQLLIAEMKATPRCTASPRYATSTTSDRPAFWRRPGCRWRVGLSGTPSSRTSTPNRRTFCSTPRRSGEVAVVRRSR